MSQFYLSNAGYSAQEQRDFCRILRERLESKPGVLGVTYSDVVPMSTASGAGSTPWHQLDVEGYAPAPNEQMMIHRATVPPGYFNLLGIRMLEGRDFTERDAAEAPMVIIVNETFANRFFHGRNPIGRKVRCEGHQATVVGLVKDSKYHTPIEGPTPFFYIPFRPMVRARSQFFGLHQDRRRPAADDPRAAPGGSGAQPGRGFQHKVVVRRHHRLTVRAARSGQPVGQWSAGSRCCWRLSACIAS